MRVVRVNALNDKTIETVINCSCKHLCLIRTLLWLRYSHRPVEIGILSGRSMAIENGIEAASGNTTTAKNESGQCESTTCRNSVVGTAE